MAVARGHLVLSDGNKVYFMNLLKVMDDLRDDKEANVNNRMKPQVSHTKIPVRNFRIQPV